jgi:hypothetical protein
MVEGHDVEASGCSVSANGFESVAAAAGRALHDDPPIFAHARSRDPQSVIEFFVAPCVYDPDKVDDFTLGRRSARTQTADLVATVSQKRQQQRKRIVTDHGDMRCFTEMRDRHYAADKRTIAELIQRDRRWRFLLGEILGNGSHDWLLIWRAVHAIEKSSAHASRCLPKASACGYELSGWSP